MNFDRAFELLIGHEGGYVNNPADPGGETKYGISKRAYPEIDIKALTLGEAKALYRRDYWIPAGCELVPDAAKFELFDLAVNTSARGNPVTAKKILQQAVGVTADGVIGPATLKALQASDPDSLQRSLWAKRIRYYTGLRKELRDNFLAGWMNRVAANIERA